MPVCGRRWECARCGTLSTSGELRKVVTGAPRCCARRVGGVRGVVNPIDSGGASRRGETRRCGGNWVSSASLLPCALSAALDRGFFRSFPCFWLVNTGLETVTSLLWSRLESAFHRRYHKPQHQMQHKPASGPRTYAATMTYEWCTGSGGMYSVSFTCRAAGRTDTAHNVGANGKRFSRMRSSKLEKLVLQQNETTAHKQEQKRKVGCYALKHSPRRKRQEYVGRVCSQHHDDTGGWRSTGDQLQKGVLFCKGTDF